MGQGVMDLGKVVAGLGMVVKEWVAQVEKGAARDLHKTQQGSHSEGDLLYECSR